MLFSLSLSRSLPLSLSLSLSLSFSLSLSSLCYKNQSVEISEGQAVTEIVYTFIPLAVELNHKPGQFGQFC